MKKDFTITIQKTGNELYIATESSSGVKTTITPATHEQMLVCIKNYIEMYIDNEESDDTLKEEYGPRVCSHCGDEMYAGYCIDEGRFYYCCDDCLHANMTQEEYLDLYDDGNGDSYWTEWDD